MHILLVDASALAPARARLTFPSARVLDTASCASEALKLAETRVYDMVMVVTHGSLTQTSPLFSAVKSKHRSTVTVLVAEVLDASLDGNVDWSSGPRSIDPTWRRRWASSTLGCARTGETLEAKARRFKDAASRTPPRAERRAGTEPKSRPAGQSPRERD